MNWKKACIFIAVVVVIMGGVVASSLLFSTNKPENAPGMTGNTAGNLYNGGYFCEDNKTVYFSYGLNRPYVYKMTSDGTITKTKFNAAYDLNVANGYLYYRRDNSKTANRSYLDGYAYGIYRANLLGKRSNNTTLTTEQADNICVLGNYIFYNTIANDKMYLCRMPIDGETKEKEERVTYLLEGWNDIVSANGSWLYYSDIQGDHKIYRVNGETGQKEMFFDGNCYQPIYDGENLYYIDLDENYALKKVNMQTQQSITLVESNCVNYNTDGNVIFYEWEDGENRDYGLFRCDGNGADKTRITNRACMNINMTSEYTYFMYFQEDGYWYRVPTNGGTEIQTFEVKEDGE